MVVLIVIMDLKPPLPPPKETGSATIDMLLVEDVEESGICVASGHVTGPVSPPQWIWVVVHVASGQPKGTSQS